MKKNYLSGLIGTLLCLFIFNYHASAYEYHFQVKGYKDTICRIAHYYGDQRHLQDSVTINHKGEFTFKGDSLPEGGVYMAVLPGKGYFEFILDGKEKSFTMESRKGSITKSMKVKNSKENRIFYNYLQYIDPLKKKAQKLQKDFKNAQHRARKKAIRKQLRDINNKIKDYRGKIINKHPDAFVTTFFKAMKEPEVPDSLKSDRKARYRYYKKHYFDNIDFSDGRLVNTPVYHNKLKYYIKKLTVTNPDSIKKSADYVLEKARASKPVFRYTLFWLTYTYESSNLMIAPNVFVHLAQNYYAAGDAFWISESRKKKILKKARRLSFSLVGKQAPNMILEDTSGNKVPLGTVQSDYTILYFYDTGCSHCRKTTPKLKELYEKYRNKGVQVYAVCIEKKLDNWRSYIQKENLNWINVADTEQKSNFRYYYDIQSTPVIYLLNSKKEIIARKLGMKSLKSILNKKLN